MDTQEEDDESERDEEDGGSAAVEAREAEEGVKEGEGVSEVEDKETVTCVSITEG